jgi:hypothetical protein
MTSVSIASTASSFPANSNSHAHNSPLVEFALRGLDRCWLASEGRWSHIYHLDGRAEPNESLPHSDVFYTLNVLLGMSRVLNVPARYDMAAIYHRNARLLTRLPVRDYAFGMALWTAAELDLELDAEVALKVRELLADRSAWSRFHAQDLGMLLIGVVAQARKEPGIWRRLAAPLFEYVESRFLGASGLFMDTSTGFRRRFASFATQVYLSMACYHYGDYAGDERAIDMASGCVRRLIALQGPRGEWPWFYDAVSGRVLDPYEVYSVHQYGMAPALLEWAERYDVAGARGALIYGFEWVFGHNQLSRCMLQRETGLSVRSQVRKGELESKRPRARRAIGNMLLGRSSGLIDSSQVTLRLECRSYELGWLLWSFGQRDDLRQLTDHPLFSPA